MARGLGSDADQSSSCKQLLAQFKQPNYTQSLNQLLFLVLIPLRLYFDNYAIIDNSILLLSVTKYVNFYIIIF